MVKDLTDLRDRWKEQTEREVGIYNHAQQSCAASPWTYRTITGDETGKVVEGMDLPERTEAEKNWDPLLIKFRPEGGECARPFAKLLQYMIGTWHIQGYGNVTDAWLRKHLIAWAEIRG